MTLSFTYAHPDGGSFTFTPPNEVQEQLQKLRVGMIDAVVNRGHDRDQAEAFAAELFQDEITTALTSVKIETRNPLDPRKTVTATLGELMDHLWARATQEMVAGLCD